MKTARQIAAETIAAAIRASRTEDRIVHVTVSLPDGVDIFDVMSDVDDDAVALDDVEYANVEGNDAFVTEVTGADFRLTVAYA